MKAVIPAAGLGTRLLPATKSMPKEMLPVVDKPVIQYVVEEAVESGIEDILIITGRGKRAIEDHFDRSFELEHHLEEKGKSGDLQRVREISDMANIHYLRQKEPLGLGHAVLCARRFIGDEPFAVLLGDDIIMDSKPATRQLLDVHAEFGRSVFSVMDVPREEISRYGAVDGEPVESTAGEQVYRVRGIIEKPSPVEAPSTLATIGRYVFTPDILEHLQRTTPGVGGEIQLTDAMASLAREQAVYAATFTGQRLDVGSVEGFLEANLAMAMRRENLATGVREMIERLLGSSTQVQPARLGA